MKPTVSLLTLAFLPLSLLAADVTGTWKAQFDTQRGLQKYAFTLRQDGTNVTGKASVDLNGATREAELKEGKVAGDTIAFVELLRFQNNDIRVVYTGLVSPDRIAFKRQVGEMGSSEAIATRGSAATSAPAPAAQPPAANAPAAGNRGDGRGGRGGFGGPIELGPDDKPAIPEPPAGFNVRRADVPHGEVKAVQYDSKTLGTRRQLRVYTPPGYSTERKYPVLYLLHGLGMDDRQWLGGCRADVVIDNLIADGKIQPIVMVFPNGDANLTVADAEAGRSSSRNGVGGRFDNWGTPFENDLLKDIIPFVESHYSVLADSEHRALAGLSMGGGQALNIGLVHPETFGYVGGFSSAPNTREFGGISPGGKLLPEPASAKTFKLIWIACGNRDGLIRVSQGVHRMLNENNVPHVWNVDSYAHDDPEWSSNLHHFAQRLFRKEGAAKS